MDEQEPAQAGGGAERLGTLRGPCHGRAAPYGIYDVAANEGFVNVGTSHDTAEFAADSIRRWWIEMGRPRYPYAHSLLITADGVGSNGSRNRLWKTALQRFADEAGLNVCVCHFPPGTSKWNKIEHRMFSVISMNWRRHPLTSVEVTVSLIAAKSTTTGLKIKAAKSDKTYACGEKGARRGTATAQDFESRCPPGVELCA